MRRWFLSYNSRDVDLVSQIEAALIRKEPDAKIFFAPKNLRAGGYWLPQLAAEIAEATAFVLFVGEHGIGPWQVLEYYEALDKRVKNPDFAVMLLLLDGQPAPGLPFLRQLHWIVAADPASEHTIAKLLDATIGGGSQPGELWRYTAPYRGLASMAETDSDFFFGRERETVTVLKALRDEPNRLPLLIGNSGVGKSSLAQAGVLAALGRQAWPEQAATTDPWPQSFGDSRRWCVLKLQPGTDPIKALIEPFLRTWQLDPVDPEWEKRRKGWFDALINDEATLSGLLDATERQHEKLGQPKPPGFLLYIDQGEELYVRSTETQRHAFSRLIGNGIKDPRLRAIMSLRSDFFGAFQNDEALYDAHRQINVGPLREAELYDVVCRPTALLGARFETESLAKDMARRTAAESVKDAGALPLLSYLLDDMWTQMVKRGDGQLRLPTQAIELGSVLADRANAFLARHPNAESQIMRIFTLKLATVREDGEPTRRRALRSEFSDDEWRRVSELADQPHRLLVVATPEAGETYTEVAHESILRHWDKLHDWLIAEREFLIWKTQLELARRRWQQTPEASKNDALLMGLALSQAQGWLMSRLEDLSAVDREFIEASLNRDLLERRHRERLQRRVLFATVAGLLVAVLFGGLATFQWYQADRNRAAAETARADAESQRALAEKEAKIADDQRNRALLNGSRRLQELAAKALGEGDPPKAALLALEGLPGPRAQEDRPYLPALESTLYQAGTQMHELPPFGLVRPLDGGKRFFADDGHGHAGIYDGETAERLVALTGHSARVTTIAIRGAMVATASNDGTARLWDAGTGRQLAVIQLGAPGVAVGFQSDGVLMTTCNNGTAALWHIPDGKRLFAISGHTGNVNYLQADNNVHRAISAGADLTFRLWDTDTGRQIAKIGVPTETATESKHSTPQIYGYFNKSGRLALVQRRTVADVSDSLILDTATGDEVAHFDNASAGFAGDGELVYVVRYNPSHFGLWDAAAKRMLLDEDTNWELETRFFVLWSKTSSTAELIDGRTGKRIALTAQAPITIVKSLPKQNRIFTASADGSGDFWDSENGQLLQHIAQVNDSDRVDSATALDNDDRLLVRGKGDTFSLWDTATGSKLLTLPHQYSYKSFSGNRFATATEDGTLQVWDAETAKPLPQPSLKGEGATKYDIANPQFSADGKRAANVVSANKIRIWDVATGKTIKDIQIINGAQYLWGFSSDDSKLLIEQHGHFQVRAVESGVLLGVINDIPHGSYGSASYTPDFSPKGSLLFATLPATTTLQTRIWRMDSASPMTSLWLGGPGEVERVQFVPGADRLLVVRKSQVFPFRVEVYDLNAGKRLQRLTGPTERFDATAGAGISDDGRHLAAHSDDNVVRIWDVKSGQVVVTIPNVVGAKASHDMLLINGKDDQVHVWNIATAKMLYALPSSVTAGGIEYWGISPDARYFATWAKTGNMRIWEASTGRQIALLAEATGATFSLDGARVFVRLDSKNSAALLETETGRTLAEFPAWQRYIAIRNNKYALLIEGNGRYTARVIDTTTGQTRASMALGDQAPTDVQPSDDANVILLVFPGGKAQAFDGQTGNPIALITSSASADAYRLSPDGRYVAIVHGNSADLYDIAARSSRPLRSHKDKISDVRFSADSQQVLTVSDSGEISLSDISTGKSLDLTGSVVEPLRFTVFGPRGHWVIASSKNGTVRTWDSTTGKIVQSASFDLSEIPIVRLNPENGLLSIMVNKIFDPGSNVVRILDESGTRVGEIRLSSEVTTLKANDTGTRLLVEESGPKATLWDIAQAKQTAQMQRDSGKPTLLFSADGQRLAAVSDDYRAWYLRLWDGTGKTDIASQKFTSKINTIRADFTPDSRFLWVLATGFDKHPTELHVFDAKTGKPVAGPVSNWPADDQISVGPNGDRILFFPEKGGDAQLWDIAGGKPAAIIPMLASNSKPTFSADEKWLATASPDHTVKIWDTSTGALRQTLSGLTASIDSIAISRDGRFVTAGSSGSAHVWEIESGKLVYTLEPNAAGVAQEPGASVPQVLFSNDGTRLALRTEHLIAIWNMSTGEQIAVIPTPNGSTPLIFSADGRLLLQSSSYGHSPIVDRIFPKIADTVMAARAAVPRCFSPAEREASYLDPEPPNWCIEMQKRPYDTAAWHDWLAQKKAGHEAALPTTP